MKRGPDRQIGQAATNANGVYKLNKNAKRGNYYATVTNETIANVADCLAARSPNKRVT